MTFNCNSLDNTDKSLEKYLSGILADLKKIQSFDQKEIIYAAEAIPIFHNFAFPELTAFKLFLLEQVYAQCFFGRKCEVRFFC